MGVGIVMRSDEVGIRIISLGDQITMVAEVDMELTSSHKYIKNTSKIHLHVVRFSYNSYFKLEEDLRLPKGQENLQKIR